jgi:hypothetical protein
MIKKIWVAILIVLMSACTHIEKDFKPQPIDQAYLPKVQMDDDIAVVGEFQDDPQNALILALPFGHKWYADENELVSTAIMAAEDILRQNKVTVNESSQKVIKISFLDANYDMGMWSTQINLIYRVKAGDEITRDFQGSQHIGSGHQMHWAIEASASDAVIKLFKDPDILKYLNN